MMTRAELVVAVFLIVVGIAIVAFVVACKFGDARGEKPNQEDRDDPTLPISIWGHRDIQPREVRR